MKLTIMENYKELEGKTITFAHFTQFENRFTIATKDKCIFMATIDEMEINVYKEGQVLRSLRFDPCMREQLGKRGLFDLDAYNEQREKEIEEIKRKAKEAVRENESM